MSRDEGERRAAILAWRYGGWEGEALLAALLGHELGGRVAVLSSFGAESALLLAMVAAIDRRVPVIFLDTGKHFGETLRYRDALAAQLGLADLRIIAPDRAAVAARDGDGTLWRRDADACCRLRKAEPLARALDGFAAVISGRKRYQNAARRALSGIAWSDGLIRIDPLWCYDRARIEEEFAARRLPPHPLEAEGFLSIGCLPCTDRVAAEEDRRAGRWRGSDKTECGIHAAFAPVAQ